jgi:hypothetical protein
MNGREALEVMKEELLSVMENDNYQITIKNEKGEEVGRKSN